VSAKLPVVSGQEAIRAFQRLGYEVVRQRGSHIRFIVPTRRGSLSPFPIIVRLSPAYCGV